MSTLTNWWLDFEEVYNNGTVLQPSYGPFEYDIDDNISVQQFLDDINDNSLLLRGDLRYFSILSNRQQEYTWWVLKTRETVPTNNFAVKYDYISAVSSWSLRRRSTTE